MAAHAFNLSFQETEADTITESQPGLFIEFQAS